jgi:hypothetical protein
MTPTVLIMAACVVLAAVAPLLLIAALSRLLDRPRRREPADRTEPPRPTPATLLHRWLQLPSLPRRKPYDGAGDGIAYAKLLRNLRVQRDVEQAAPQALPLDPEEQRWAAEIAEFRAHLDAAVEACARGIYRAQLKTDEDALTSTGTWDATGLRLRLAAEDRELVNA